jgi:hypothetical protein
LEALGTPTGTVGAALAAAGALHRVDYALAPPVGRCGRPAARPNARRRPGDALPTAAAPPRFPALEDAGDRPDAADARREGVLYADDAEPEGCMDTPRGEDLLAMAERHVREGEARLARLRAAVAASERAGHPEAAAKGGELLAAVERSLELMRGHLRLERALHGRRQP